MLFVWIDKCERLDHELTAVQHGDPRDPFKISRYRLGRAVIGRREGGVFATSQHRRGDRCTCAWGELYNRAQLRGLLTIDDASGPVNDAQLLAGLVDRFGPQGLARANGQFAVIQWDAAAGRLLAATDQFSILPLRYYEDADRLIVASDARMILACPNVDDRLDPQAVYDYVSMSVIPAPRTVYHSIRKLPPRHVLVLDERVSIEPYCRLSFPEDARGSQAEMAHRLREVIAASVARRRAADPPETEIGAFLSGGLDSSTIVAALAGRLADYGTPAQQEDRPVRVFSIGFAESRFDEMDYARLAARHFGAEHHTYTVTAADTSAIVDAVLDQFDEPFGNSSSVAVYYCAKLAADAGVKTLYAGDGGDELFAGNPQYLWDRYFQIYQTIPKWLRRGLIEPVAFHWPMGDRIGLVRKARSYLRRANVPNPDRIAGYEFLETVPAVEVFRGEFLSMVDTNHPMAVRRSHYEQAGECSELSRVLCHELALVVADNDLRKVSEMSVRAGVRVVYPMLDPELVALAGSIPSAWQLRRFKLRAFYKRAMRGVMPDEILAKEKQGFGLPISVWLKNDPALRQRMADAFAGRTAGEMFRQGFLDDLNRRVRADQTNYYGSIAWVLLILLEWLDRFAQRRDRTTPNWAI